MTGMARSRPGLSPHFFPWRLPDLLALVLVLFRPSPACFRSQRRVSPVLPAYKTTAHEDPTDLSRAGLVGDDVGGPEDDHDCPVSSWIVGEEREREGN